MGPDGVAQREGRGTCGVFAVWKFDMNYYVVNYTKLTDTVTADSTIV